MSVSSGGVGWSERREGERGARSREAGPGDDECRRPSESRWRYVATRAMKGRAHRKDRRARSLGRLIQRREREQEPPPLSSPPDEPTTRTASPSPPSPLQLDRPPAGSLAHSNDHPQLPQASPPSPATAAAAAPPPPRRRRPLTSRHSAAPPTWTQSGQGHRPLAPTHHHHWPTTPKSTSLSRCASSPSPRCRPPDLPHPAAAADS